MIINKKSYAEIKIIFFLTFSIFIFRWSTLFYSSLESFNNLILFSIEDYLYFPFILNLSEFNLKPDYLDNPLIESSLPIPIYSIILHSLFYKLFGLYSFLILEIFFLFLFIYLLTKILEKFNLNFAQSILVSLLLIIFLNINYVLKYFYSIPYFGIENLFSYRFPRPLVSSVYFLLGFLIVLDFFKNHKNKNYFFYILLGFVLALNFGSVFYNFIILSLLLFFSFLKKIYNLNFELSLFFLKKKFVLLMSFIFFSLPFLWIIFNSETTYLERIGVIKLDYIQKFYLFKYLFSKITTYHFLFVLLIIFYLFFLLLKKKKLNSSTIIFFLIFFLSSILSLFLFVLFSPSITEVYHSVNLVVVSTLLTIFVFINLIILTYKNNYFIYLTQKKFKIFCSIFLLFILFLSFINNQLLKKKDLVMRNDFINLDHFFKTNSDSKKINSLLTFNSKVQVWWMFSGKNNFNSIYSIFSSLNNNILEVNFLNNLKFLNLSESDLKNILRNEKKGWRYNNLYLQYFSYYKYQANSLYTFNNSQDFNPDVLSFIRSSSPLYTQQIAIPNYEIERITNDYKKIKISSLDYPDIIILEKNSLIHNKSKINSLYYCELKNFYYFNIYVDKRKFECS
jgi:hypothetical protein